MANIASKVLRAIPKKVRKQSKPLVQAALRSSARNVGRQLSEAIRDRNQPTGVLLDNLTTALKTGALDAAGELMTWGLDHAFGGKSKKRK